ncbi:MAG: hypothetical protein K0R44_291 [Thermomicrobiales bacterium]|nr:hypothetical protein [Thermomicrobiales bacterium]
MKKSVRHLRHAIRSDGGDDSDLVVVEQITVRFRDRRQDHGLYLFTLPKLFRGTINGGRACVFYRSKLYC